MVRKVTAGLVVALFIAATLAVLPVAARNSTPPRPGPVVAGRVVSIDATNHVLGVRGLGHTAMVSTDASTIIVGVDEGYPSREGTIIAFSAIRLGDLAGAVVRPDVQPDGSRLAVSLIINHRDFLITGRVISHDESAKVFALTWVNWKRHRVRSTIHYSERTRVRQRGRPVPISRMTIGSLVHVAGYVANDGLVAKGIKILWARRVGQSRR